MYVIRPLAFMNMPWVTETSESLRRLIPWFLNCLRFFAASQDGKKNILFQGSFYFYLLLRYRLLSAAG